MEFNFLDAMNELQQALKTHYGFPHFLEGQEETIRGAIDGSDSLVIMPTGSGKSICYQLTAMLLDGVTLVVSPLIALMKDQVDALEAKGIPATFLNSSIDTATLSQRMRDAREGKYKLIYVAPERFQNAAFASLLHELNVEMLAIDEAHCISQWGHDFRPDYLKVKHVVAALPRARVMALTATATPIVKDDIVTQLGLGTGGRSAPDVRVFGFERPNLDIRVRRVNSHAEKLSRVMEAVEQWTTGIIYCATRKQVEKVGAELKRSGASSVLYHGGLDDATREKVQNQFIQKKADVVVATNAFGMGIDRDDVRCVIHWDIPGSLEAYYQEIGRAGRDGEDACCELLYSYADVRTQEFFMEGANPSAQLILNVYKTVKRCCQHGPVTYSAAEWAEMVDGAGKNSMAVSTALYLLDRAGLVSRSMEPGSRSYAYGITTEDPAEPLKQIVDGLAEKRARDQLKLDTMIRYANSVVCRHRGLLEYFGEPPPPGTCTMCDNCTGGGEDRRAPATEEEWVLVQKVLSGVARMQGRFGKARIAQMLLGSKAKPVLDAGLDQIPTHGALSGKKDSFVKQMIDELTRDGSIDIAPGEYPTLAISPRGRQVVSREIEPQLVWLEERTSKTKRKSPAIDDADAADVDPVLFDALRNWRNEEARSRSLPAYRILSDKCLQSIVQAQPSSAEELTEVWGMGPYKVTQFGDDIIKLIAESDA